MRPKLKYARELVRQQLHRQGIKLSYVESGAITKAANELLKHYPTWVKLRQLKRKWTTG